MCEFIQSSNSFTQLHNSIYLKKRSERNYKLYVTLKFHSGMNSLLTFRTSVQTTLPKITFCSKDMPYFNL